MVTEQTEREQVVREAATEIEKKKQTNIARAVTVLLVGLLVALGVTYLLYRETPRVEPGLQTGGQSTLKVQETSRSA